MIRLYVVGYVVVKWFHVKQSIPKLAELPESRNFTRSFFWVLLYEVYYHGAGYSIGSPCAPPLALPAHRIAPPIPPLKSPDSIGV